MGDVDSSSEEKIIEHLSPSAPPPSPCDDRCVCVYKQRSETQYLDDTPFK